MSRAPRNRGERIAGVQYSVTPPAQEHMAVFDALPPAVRQAISASDYDFNTIAIARAMRCGMSEAVIVSMIENQNQAIREAADVSREE